MLTLLYRTLPGRLLLRLLTWPVLSRACGRFLDSPLSKPLIRPFIRRNAISMEGVIVPPGGFDSFNCFFTRQRYCPVYFLPGWLGAPCDGWLSVYPLRKKDGFTVKGCRYTLSRLLADPALAAEYRDGWALVFRLTPANYHRYCWADGGTAAGKKRVEGVLHTVRPIAVESRPVYHENTREYTLLNSDHFDRLIQMEVGAMLVGKIHNHPAPGRVEAGQEKGWFAYGGSTVILLVQPGRLRLHPSLETAKAQEIYVKTGRPLGRSTRMLPGDESGG